MLALFHAEGEKYVEKKVLHASVFKQFVIAGIEGIDDMDKAEAAKGLSSATGYLRRVLAQKLNLRITPTLTFVEDDSMAHGAYISKLIMENAPTDTEEDETEA